MATTSVPSSTISTANNSALSNPSSRKPRKRAKVSFSEEVISKDIIGDGSKVVIKEEHGIFLGPLLGRMVVSSDQKDGVDGTDTSNAAVPSSGPTISFANDSHTNEKMACSESQHGILKSTNNALQLGDSNVEYDNNLVVRMGLLKCGYRYRVVIPVPDYWKQAGDTAHESNAMDVRIAEDSLDDDLRGEVQTEYSSETTLRQHHVCITLSARRRGPYRGRFVLELTRRQDGIESQSISPSKFSQKTGSIKKITTEAKSDSIISGESTTFNQKAMTSNESNTNSTPNKCLMYMLDATIMGNDMGTPKLRNGVVCLGKIVGYDSDEETEWQGFE
mmetsp:Transcript_10709/g.23719  ORF Transcript_10709/g.23719 Transcript_10709/m.23719 type:complete len:333 (-) Transcript_10709:131-1129(-)